MWAPSQRPGHPRHRPPLLRAELDPLAEALTTWPCVRTVVRPSLGYFAPVAGLVCAACARFQVFYSAARISQQEILLRAP
jgi:hypothetical protein